MNRRESNKETGKMNPSMTIAPAAVLRRLCAVRLALAATAALAAVAVFCAVPAGAVVTHEAEGSFYGSERPTYGTFGYSLPSVAADRSSGDVWVVEAQLFGFLGKAKVVDKFESDGTYAGVQLTGATTPQGSFAFGSGEYFGPASGIAVDNTSGPNRSDLYVADSENHVVDRFDEAGTFLCQITAKEPAARSSAEEAAECDGAAGSQVPGTASIEPTGVAVDSAGDLYVADKAHSAVDVFGPGGEYLRQITSPELGKGYGLGLIALDSAGDLYVSNDVENVVKFDSSGSFEETLDEGNSPGGVGVDPANDHVYIGDRRTNPTTGSTESAIAEYEAGATGSVLVSVFGFRHAENGFGGITVGANGRIYASDLLSYDSSFEGNARVSMYGPDIVLPDVTTGAASGVSDTTATLHGEVSLDAAHGGGSVETCEFEYASEFTLHHAQKVTWEIQEGYHGSEGFLLSFKTIETEVLAPSATSEEVQQALEALSTIGTGNVSVAGSPGGPWTVEFVGELEDVTVPMLEASVTGFDQTVTVAPDWASASTAACEPPVPYGSNTSVSAHVEGLAPAMKYEYRLVASNANGSSRGAFQSLQTSGPPAIDREAVQAEQTTALFRAKIRPLGHETSCRVEYVSDASFQETEWANATALTCLPEDLGAGFEDVVVKAKATGLARATSYQYRFVATNSSGVSSRAGTFETYGIRRFNIEVLKSNEELPALLWKPGEAESPLLAGAHPFELVTSIFFSRTSLFHKCEAQYSCPGGELGEEDEQGGAVGLNTKDIKVELPPGLLGNPGALPICSQYLADRGECPVDSQVGELEYKTDYPLRERDGFEQPLPEEEFEKEQCQSYCLVALYNLESPTHHPAEFGNPAFFATSIPFEVRTGADYGITSNSVNLVAAAPITALRVRVWGVPADPAHQLDRETEGCPRSSHGHCTPEEPEVPLLRNPTSCTGPLTATVRADTWTEPGQFVSKTAEVGEVAGCNALQFQPSLEALPTTNVADAPSGLNVKLKVPQNEEGPNGQEDPHGVSSADLRDAKVVLPKGIAVNPASANGLAACTSAQIELHGPKAPTCPDASKIGRVEVLTPLIKEYDPTTGKPTEFHPLPGSVYVAQPHDNPFNSLLAIYVVVDDAKTGTIIKLAGHIEADPQTGQLTTTFDENPQLPFDEFKLDFFGGAKAALRTPATCGKYESAWTLTPWSAPESGPPSQGTSPFEITQAPAAAGGKCATSASQEPSAPGFEAGTETSTAGKYSPFILHLHREDGSQELTTLDTTLPEGLLGKLAGVSECSDGAIAAARTKSGTEELASPSCAASSQVGTVKVASGAGPAPYWVTGHAYLAGPYEGAPLSLVIVTPAVAGPYDLGDVVVRAALYVNPETTQITVKSDRIPTMLQGIPLDVRTINVKMDRPQFTLNPTSCEKMAVTGEVSSVFGASSPLSNPFQVGGCRSLAFKPHLAILLKGKTNRSAHPALTATLTMPPGDANIASAQVTLPHSEFLDQAHIQTICTRVQFASHSCPANSVYGFAKAWSPLLDKPLEGPVYLRSSSHKLPDLVADLNGQIEVVLDGKVDSVHASLRNTFEMVPDAPVSKFVLAMRGGKKGLIVNSRDLCLAKTNRKALADFIGQNGLVARGEPKVKARCGGKSHTGHGHGKHHRGKHH